MIVITMWIHTSSNYCSMIVLLHTHAFAGNNSRLWRTAVQYDPVKQCSWLRIVRYKNYYAHTTHTIRENTAAHKLLTCTRSLFTVCFRGKTCHARLGNNDRGTRSNFVKPFSFWDSKAILLLSRVTLSSVHYNRNFQNHSWFSVCDVITVSVTSSQCLWRDPQNQWKGLTIAVFNLQS